MKTLNSHFLKSNTCRFIFLLFVLFLSPLAAEAQGPGGRPFGLGIILGEPFGLTAKVWTSPVTAFVGDIGQADFGPLRLQMDYLWHFSSDYSSVVRFYAGPGLALAFGSGNPGFDYEPFPGAINGIGIGGRVMFGIDFVPHYAPFEVFFELGPLISFVPAVGGGLDGGIGFRFYP